MSSIDLPIGVLASEAVLRDHPGPIMDERRYPRQTAGVPPALTGSLTRPQLNAAPRRAGDPAQECCDRCGSIRLIRVKSCWRCDACGYKSDCNGW
jgi:hypothetical protein